jgi:hypothetical protein
MFETAASGLASINTITFEGLAVGFNSTFNAAQGVTVDVNAPNLGNGLSGINDFTLGNLNGFNVTLNGTQWFGFPHGIGYFQLRRADAVFRLLADRSSGRDDDLDDSVI